MEFDSPVDAGRLTDAQMEELAVKTYEEHLGRTILVHAGGVSMEYEDGGSDYESPMDIDPPLLCRVSQTPEEDVLRWGDRDHVDPYWETEILGNPARVDRNGRRYKIVHVFVDGITIGRNGPEPLGSWELIEDIADAPLAHEGVTLGYY